MQTETANTAVALTSLTQTAAGAVAFKVRTTNPDAAALLASTGDETGIETDTGYTGVYAWAPEAPFPVPDPGIQYEGAGVWGDSPDDGVVGTGGLSGVIGIGGGAGVVGLGDDGVVGVGGPTGAGVRAFGDTSTTVALGRHRQGQVQPIQPDHDPRWTVKHQDHARRRDFGEPRLRGSPHK